VSLDQEGIHTINMEKIPRMVMKIDLTKAHNRVNRLYIRYLLIQMGTDIQFVNWKMGFFSLAYFIVLINGSPSYFSFDSRWVREDFPLSPFLFLFMVEGLIISILTSEREVSIKGIKVTCLINLIHIHFVDGVMIFGVGTRKEMSKYGKILDLYYKETNTKVNVQKLLFFLMSWKNTWKGKSYRSSHILSFL